MQWLLLAVGYLFPFDLLKFFCYFLQQVTASHPSNVSVLNPMTSPGDMPVAGDQTTPDPKKTEVLGKIEENRPAEQLETLSLILTGDKRASDVVHQRGLHLPISPH